MLTSNGADIPLVSPLAEPSPFKGGIYSLHLQLL